MRKKSPPFAISSQALVMIEEAFTSMEKNPEVAKMVPSLFFCLNSQSSTKDGRTFERIRVSHFCVGWYFANKVTGWARFDLLGRKIALPASTLKLLTGKKLVVRTVESGYPNRAAAKARVLRAVPAQT